MLMLSEGLSLGQWSVLISLGKSGFLYDVGVELIFFQNPQGTEWKSGKSKEGEDQSCKVSTDVCSREKEVVS